MKVFTDLLRALRRGREREDKLKMSIGRIFLAFGFLMSLIAVPLFARGSRENSDRVEELLGAGATFPYPLYSKMFSEYGKLKGVRINYQAIGSGGGIRQLLSKTVDFGGTDAFMDDKDLAKAKASTNNEILHIPICLGAVVITYNLALNSLNNGLKGKHLRLTPDVIGDIFLEKIKRWNDLRISKLNPGIKFPEIDITVVHRSDGSGTTFVFSDYLSKVNPEWKERIGSGKLLDWPVGIGGKGNPGVAGLVKQIKGSIGYVELVYAVQNKMPYAAIKNSNGNFIIPSLSTVSLAADIDIPEDTRISITNTRAGRGYPISSFTWIIFYKEQHYGGRSLKRAQELLSLLWWMIHDGQKYTGALEYAKLPDTAVRKAETIINSVVYDGKPIRFNR